MSTLSVIIITKNEQGNISRCLESIKWANEIIIVDSGSTDNTLTICREYTNNIHETNWPGYGIQKNRALSYATQQWILSIDADETVSEGLAAEIQAAIRNEQADAYQINRQLIFYSKPIKHVGSDRIIRLFKREKGEFTDEIVHEKIIVEGSIKSLNNPLYHHSFKDIQQLVDKMNYYTSLSAQSKFDKGRNPSAALALLNCIWVFIRLFIFKGGFLDGKRGLVLSFSFAEGAFYRYIKCAFLHIHS